MKKNTGMHKTKGEVVFFLFFFTHLVGCSLWAALHFTEIAT